MQKCLRLIAKLIVARHECTTFVRMYGTIKKRTNLYVLRSTENAYDVISHRRLSGPRAPKIFWTSLRLCFRVALSTVEPRLEDLVSQNQAHWSQSFYRLKYSI